MNSMNMWQSVQVYKLPKLLIASLFALLVALLSFIGSAAVSAETQVSVTPYENLSTTSTTVVMVSVSGLTPNTDVAIRQVAINYVQEPGFTGNRIEQLHKAVVTTDGSGAFSVQIPVRYDVRTDQTFSDYCQNDTALRRLCYLHVQYQSDESTDVIAQPKLYFGVSGPVVDTTAPTVTIVTPADKAVYQQNGVVPVQYACVDVPNATSVVTCDGDLLKRLTT